MFFFPQNEDRCISHGSLFECICENQSNCLVHLWACLVNPCKNGGTCSPQKSGHSCRCATAFTGKNCEIELMECGSQYWNPNGFIRYPLSPSSTANKSQCTWLIETEQSKVLHIEILRINLEPSIACIYNSLQVRNSINIFYVIYVSLMYT